MQKNTLKDRLALFLKYLGVGQAAFANNVGLSKGFANNVGDSIRTDNLNKITACYPELNTVWLLTGEGEMLKQNTAMSNTIVGDSNSNIQMGGHGSNLSQVSNQEYQVLIDRIKKLEEENEQLKKDKAILQEFITFLQNKK